LHRVLSMGGGFLGVEMVEKTLFINELF